MELIWILASYLLGSIPAAYIVARAVRGIDIRQVGTRNVGGGNVWEQISFRAFLLVALADMGKAALAVGVSQRLGFALWVQVACGWSAIIGHNYSIFLRGRGGKGISPFVGALLVLGPWEAVAFILTSYLHYVLRQVGIFSTKTLARVPPSVRIFADGGVWTLETFGVILLLAFARGEPFPVIIYIVVGIILHQIKRVQDVEPPWRIPQEKRRAIIINRFFLDRSTRG